MMKNIFSAFMVALILVGTSTLAFHVQPVRSDWTWTETIYIRVDGSINPPTAPISSVDNITYTLTDNIVGDVLGGTSAIVVERDNIAVDGVGYTVQGTGYYASKGIALYGRTNVTIRNARVANFDHGIFVNSSSSSIVTLNTASNNNCGICHSYSNKSSITGNNITATNDYGIWLGSSSNNSISGNNITATNWNGIRLDDSFNNTISGNSITSNTWGVSFHDSSNNTISRNRITNNTDYGVYVNDSSNNTISRNRITNNTYGVSLYSFCDSNTISGNTMANNTYGVSLSDSSSNSVSANNITNNEIGIFTDYSSNNNTIFGNKMVNNTSFGVYQSRSYSNKFYHNSFIDNTQQVSIVGIVDPTFWDDGYSSGGNYWSDYSGIDIYCGASQDQPGSDGIGDTQYVIDVDNVDHYPLMIPYGSSPSQIYNLTITMTAGGTTSPPPNTYQYANGSIVQVTAIPETYYLFDHWELNGSDVGSANPYSVWMDADYLLHAVFVPKSHDIAVTNITLSKTIIGESYSLTINITVSNQGDFTETFNVTIHGNTTLISTLANITLPSGNSSTLTFTWNTTGVAKGNYTISAYAWLVPEEIDTADNTYVDSWVFVTILGDADGDRDVDIFDIVRIATIYGVVESDPTYDPNCDVDDDGDIDIFDIVAAATHYGESW